MKVEPRGKYAGVKLHLDKDECQKLLNFYTSAQDTASGIILSAGTKFLLGMGKKVKDLLIDHPNLLHDRTDDEIHATLCKEAGESKLKLEAMGKGLDWKKIKVEVVK